jgi:hypothetical protein
MAQARSDTYGLTSGALCVSRVEGGRGPYRKSQLSPGHENQMVSVCTCADVFASLSAPSTLSVQLLSYLYSITRMLFLFLSAVSFLSFAPCNPQSHLLADFKERNGIL